MLSFLLLTSAVANVSLLCLARHYYKSLELAQNCASFGCKTRQWVDRRSYNGPEVVIFMDIDKMKTANTEFGYDGTNSRIKQALDKCRESKILSARWQMGDELVAFAKGDGPVITARIEQSFRSVGLSVSAAWALRSDSRPIEEWVGPLATEVLNRKAARDAMEK